jgi:hypothetical protein
MLFNIFVLKLLVGINSLFLRRVKKIKMGNGSSKSKMLLINQ